MTFAEELRHVISVEPVLDSYPAPDMPAPGEPDIAWTEYDNLYGEWVKSRIPKKRDPGPVRVLEVWEGFDELLVMCRAKDLFNRPVWTEMNPSGGTDKEQLEKFLRTKILLPSLGALWTQGTYFRLFFRVNPWICYATLSVGSGMTIENGDEAHRALYDVGIRLIENQFHRDTPILARIIREGRWELEDDPQKRYVTGRRRLLERP